MKLTKLIIASLCLNVALGVMWFLRQKPAPAADSPSPAPQKQVVIRTEVERITDKVDVAGKQSIVKDSWRGVGARDRKQYIANLRAINCPEETIRDIILADINREYASRWKAIMMPEPLKYWEPWDASIEYYNPKLRDEKLALEKERDDLIRDLFGFTHASEQRKYEMVWNNQDREQQLLGFLPEAKRRAILEANERDRKLREQLTSQIRTEPGMTTAVSGELSAELNRLQQETKNTIRGLLTPEEYDQYIMRVSPTADSVRSQLIGFNPTQQEYEAIFRARLATENVPLNFADVQAGKIDQAAMQQRSQSLAEQAKVLRETLGEERYTEYQRNMDMSYRELVRIAQQENLPSDLAGRVYSMKATAESEANRIRSNQELSAEQRTASLQALQQQTQKSVEQALGSSAFNNYNMRGGYWIRNLAR